MIKSTIEKYQDAENKTTEEISNMPIFNDQRLIDNPYNMFATFYVGCINPYFYVFNSSIDCSVDVPDFSSRIMFHARQPGSILSYNNIGLSSLFRGASIFADV